MSIYRTFWTSKSYMVGGERWWWYGAVLEINMLNAMERVACRPIREINLTECNEKHWIATDNKLYTDTLVAYEVWMQEEMPVPEDKEHTIINDHRPKDKFWLDKEHSAPPRPGFKALPLEFRF